MPRWWGKGFEMTDDYMVVFGCLAVLASLPGLLNAYSGGRSPGVWAVLLIAGVACVTVVLVTNPTTYTFDTLPDAFERVFAKLTS